MPGQGDGVRSFPPLKDGKPLWWKTANRNKKFATLDLRKPEGVALFKQLLPKFDVLIENFRPGARSTAGDCLRKCSGRSAATAGDPARHRILDRTGPIAIVRALREDSKRWED